MHICIYMCTYIYTRAGLVDTSSWTLTEPGMLCTKSLLPSRCPCPQAHWSSNKLNDFTQESGADCWSRIVIQLKVMREKCYWPNLNLYVQAILWTIYESRIHSDLIISKVSTRPDWAWVINYSAFLQLKLTCFGLLYSCHLLCSYHFFCGLHALWHLLCPGPSNSFPSMS